MSLTRGGRLRNSHSFSPGAVEQSLKIAVLCRIISAEKKERDNWVKSRSLMTACSNPKAFLYLCCSAGASFPGCLLQSRLLLSIRVAA